MLGGSQGSIRMAIHDGSGRKGLPPPPWTKVTIVGANGIYDRENGRAIFGTQSFGSQTPPPPHPLSITSRGAALRSVDSASFHLPSKHQQLKHAAAPIFGACWWGF